MTQQQNQLSILEETLEYTFRDRSLLETALTHTSFVKGTESGKRTTNALSSLATRCWSSASASTSIGSNRSCRRAR